MLRLPSRSGAGFKQTISQLSPSESLPEEQDYPLLPGLGSAPGMWAPTDRSGWGGTVGGRGVGLGKEPWERCQMELRGPGTVRGWSGHPALSSGPCY